MHDIKAIIIKNNKGAAARRGLREASPGVLWDLRGTAEVHGQLRAPTACPAVLALHVVCNRRGRTEGTVLRADRNEGSIKKGGVLAPL
jgi:hypothetical protein